jgi:hypothetical protein
MTQMKREFEGCGCLPYKPLEAKRVSVASPAIPTRKATQKMQPVGIPKVPREPVIVPLKPVQCETYAQYYAKLRDRKRRSHHGIGLILSVFKVVVEPGE